jgi:hypothetical protein
MAVRPVDQGSSVDVAAAKRKRVLTSMVAVTLLVGLVATAIMLLTTVSSRQLLVPRNAPFGMVGSSQVVAEAQTKVGLDIIAYPNQSAAVQAAEHGAVYGAYVAGQSSDTLIVVPSRSFFAWTEIEPTFLAAAHGLHRPVTVQTVKPLPASDNIGAVVSILLVPLLVGSYLCTLVVFIFTKTARDEVDLPQARRHHPQPGGHPGPRAGAPRRLMGRPLTPSGDQAHAAWRLSGGAGGLATSGLGGDAGWSLAGSRGVPR